MRHALRFALPLLFVVCTTATAQTPDSVFATAHLDFKDPIGDDPQAVVARFDARLAFLPVQDSSLTLTLVGGGGGVNQACLADSHKTVISADSVRIEKTVGLFDPQRVLCGADKVEGNTEVDCSGDPIEPFTGEGANLENGRWFCVSWLVAPTADGATALLELRQMPSTPVPDRACIPLDPMRCDMAVRAERETPWPAGFVLYPSYPNPSVGETQVVYELSTARRVTLAIYDLRGQRVRTLVEARQSAGRHTARWDGTATGGRRVAAGVYLVRLTAGDATQTHVVVRVR